MYGWVAQYKCYPCNKFISGCLLMRRVELVAWLCLCDIRSSIFTKLTDIHVIDLVTKCRLHLIHMFPISTTLFTITIWWFVDIHGPLPFSVSTIIPPLFNIVLHSQYPYSFYESMQKKKWFTITEFQENENPKIAALHVFFCNVDSIVGHT